MVHGILKQESCRAYGTAFCNVVHHPNHNLKVTPNMYLTLDPIVHGEEGVTSPKPTVALTLNPMFNFHGGEQYIA